MFCLLFGKVKAYGIGVSVAYPPDTDTPGFETENLGKPEVTRLIGEDAGGLFSPAKASRSHGCIAWLQRALPVLCPRVAFPAFSPIPSILRGRIIPAPAVHSTLRLP